MQDANDFSALAEQIEHMNSELLALTSELDAFAERAITITKQKKRGLPIKDTTFAGDFSLLCTKTGAFVSKSEDFWRSLNSVVRDGKVPQDNSIAVRGVGAKARQINKAMEEFVSVFRYVQSTAKSCPVTLNMWTLETHASDLERISGKILFVTRELSKSVEQSARRQQP